jgi:hypothetical protein
MSSYFLLRNKGGIIMVYVCVLLCATLIICNVFYTNDETEDNYKNNH